MDAVDLDFSSPFGGSEGESISRLPDLNGGYYPEQMDISYEPRRLKVEALAGEFYGSTPAEERQTAIRIARLLFEHQDALAGIGEDIIQIDESSPEKSDNDFGDLTLHAKMSSATGESFDAFFSAFCMAACGGLVGAVVQLRSGHAITLLGNGSRDVYLMVDHHNRDQITGDLASLGTGGPVLLTVDNIFDMQDYITENYVEPFEENKMEGDATRVHYEAAILTPPVIQVKDEPGESVETQIGHMEIVDEPVNLAAMDNDAIDMDAIDTDMAAPTVVAPMDLTAMVAEEEVSSEGKRRREPGAAESEESEEKRAKTPPPADTPPSAKPKVRKDGIKKKTLIKAKRKSVDPEKKTVSISTATPVGE